MAQAPRDATAAWRQLDALLDRLYAAGPDERQRMIDELEQADPDLVDTVRRLLRAADSDVIEPGGALSTGVLAGVEAAGEGTASTAHPDRIGPWRIVRELGRGGMGVVYLAERAEGDFEQRAALKLLPAGPQSDDLLSRFEQERRIVAALEHPNIARLVDGGVTDEGAPWFAMEYVEGDRIDRYCDRQRLSIDQRLQLFTEVARAVQAAHRSLVVHRDLKPANILVTDDGPTKMGTVKLLDFGIAKLLEPDGASAEVTRTLQRVLTPEYATPEQIRGEAVTTASDVYQLGLLLHELLTGRRAHQLEDTTPQGIERTVCDEPPTRASLAVVRSSQSGTGADSSEALAAVRDTTPPRLARRLRGDLDTILLTALRKEPERRYASAEQMAADVRRHLESLPVEARSDSLAYRASKFIRRHAVVVAAAAAVLVTVATLVVFYTQRLRQERSAAVESAATAQQEASRAESLREFLLDLFQAAGPTRPRNQLPTTEEILSLGAERAMDEQAASPVERVGMLLTVGRVYLQRHLLQQARPLIDAAVVLAREHREERPQDLAQALADQAALAWHGDGTLDDAEAALLEAEELVAGKAELWNLFAAIRSDRGWVASLRDDQEQALRLLEPLYAEMQQHDDLRLAARYEIVDRLAGSYHRSGDLQAAAARHREATELAKRVFGSQGVAYALHLANSANVERELGRYQDSDSRNLQAIDLYDRIYSSTPSLYRAVARRNRVRTLLAMGRFEEGLSELAVSTDEFSRLRGVPPQEDANRFYHQGEMRIQMHDWDEAVASLKRAQDIYRASPDTEPDSLIKTESMLAWALCRLGRLERAEAALEALAAHRPGDFPNDNRSRAQLHTSRACVDAERGRSESALAAITDALQAVTHPGRVVDRADRLMLRARILVALDRLPEAAHELDQAESLYRDLDLAEHPLFAEIDTVRRELFPN